IDANGRLLGTLSDGDVRRGLLRGLSLGDKVIAAMAADPTCATVDEDRQSILATMRRLGLHQIPIVDSEDIVVGLEVVDDFLTIPVRDRSVGIMAGGMGRRLVDLRRHTLEAMLTDGSRARPVPVVRAYA